MFKVRQVHAASRFAFLRPRLSAPEAIEGEPICKVAQSDLGSVFCGETRQSIRAASRTDAAGDMDHNERIEGEAVAIVHAPDVRFLFLSSSSRCPSLASRRLIRICPVAQQIRSFAADLPNGQIDPKAEVRRFVVFGAKLAVEPDRPPEWQSFAVPTKARGRPWFITSGRFAPLFALH
jgi:hypothetical protein